VIGAIRRECLDHVIVPNEADLYRHLKPSVPYDHESGTHLWLARDTLEPRTRWTPDPSLPYRELAVFTTGTSGAQSEFRRTPSRPLAGTGAPRLGPA
jgi:hypothetical protein